MKHSAIAVALLLVCMLLTGCSRSDRARYESAQKALAAGEYELALSGFTELGNYEDSSRYIMYINAVQLAEGGSFEAAANSLATLGDLLDSPMLSLYYTARQYEAEGSFSSAIEVYAQLLAFRDSAERAGAAEAYLKAQTAESEGRYQYAHDVYLSIGDYLDSADRAAAFERAYADAEALLESGSTEEAAAAFDRLLDYNGSFDRAASLRYAEGVRLLELGSYDAAAAAFDAAGPYRDAPYRALGAFFRKGEALQSAGEYAAAEEAFLAAGDYEGAREQIPATRYQKGVALLESGDYDEAYDAFLSAGDRSDAADRALEAQYAKGVSLPAQSDYTGAEQAFAAADGFSDASEQLKETLYLHAGALRAAGDPEQAYLLYTELGDYRDVSDILSNDPELAFAGYALQYAVGNTVTLGSYGDQPIEWLVLDAEGDRRTLLSVMGLDHVPYATGSSGRYTGREDSSLRTWLNVRFCEAAFSDADRAMLVPGPTDDLVWLLSTEEFTRYLADSPYKRCMPTEYAVRRGAFSMMNKYETTWWLRTRGTSCNSPVMVDWLGEVDLKGAQHGTVFSATVRPAIVVDLSGLR